MTLGRTVRIFLVDGTPTGVVTAEIMNWTGHVLVGPRSRLPDVLRREEAARTGVYFLIGDDPEDPLRPKVYVGETDDFAYRVRSHSSDESKEFWTRLCVVTSKDQNLTKAHVRYLEGRLVEMVRLADRATLVNGNTPPGGQLPESDIADMEFFIGQMEVVLPTVGFDFLRLKPAAQVKPRMAPDEGTNALDLATRSEIATGVAGGLSLHLNSPRSGITAEAIMAEDGEITVLKGSKAQKGEDYSSNSYGRLRDKLIKEGDLSLGEEGTHLIFTTDVTFKSPSAASAVIFNRNDNGRNSWHVKSTGQTLGKWQDSALPADLENLFKPRSDPAP
jgi:hypothetical protein